MAKGKGKRPKSARRESTPARPREMGTAQVTGLAIPTRTPAGVSRPATPSTSLGLITVYRCVSLLAATVTQLQLVGRQGEAGYPLPSWVRRPSPWTLRDIHAYWVSSLALSGGLAALAVRDATAGYQVAPLDPMRVSWRSSSSLPPDATSVDWELDGKPIQRLPMVERDRLYGRPYLLHRPLLAAPGHPFGLGPIQAAAQTLGYALDVERYGADVYSNPVPQGVLSSDQELLEGKAREYRDQWLDEAAPVRVVGNGLTFTPLRLSPKDAAWLEARQYDDQAVARLIGVPARKLGLPSGDSVTYATARDNDQEFLRYTVMQYVNPIEDAWSQLLPPGRGDLEDVRAELDTTAFLNSWTAEAPVTPTAAELVSLLTPPPALPEGVPA